MPVKPSARPIPQRPLKMAVRKSIVWLASYPKSGNTWVRMFLANYLLGSADTPVSINDAHRLGIGDSVSVAYRKANHGRYDVEDRLGHLQLRDKVIRGVASNGADVNFMKTHNVNDVAFGTRLIDPAYSRAAVYIVRDPRDVTVSYARHYGQTPSEACRSISDPNNTVMADATSVMQYLGDWSDHVRGWTRARGFNVQTMRYEDMKADPAQAFRQLLTFLGMPVDPSKLERAIAFSSFDELKKQETTDGFIERSPNASQFFHTGKSRQWEGVLSDEDTAFLEQKHAQQMKRFGYL